MDRTTRLSPSQSDPTVLGKRLADSFYTIQEFAPYAKDRDGLISKNVAFLAENAQSLPKSWFPDDFVLRLTQVLKTMEGDESEGLSAEKKHLLLNHVLQILYYALRRRGGSLRLPDFSVLLRTLRDTLASNGPVPSVGATLLGFRLLNKLNSIQKGAVLDGILHSIELHGPTLLSEASGAIKMELMTLIRSTSLGTLNRLTQSYIASFAAQENPQWSFLDYVLPFLIYKRYAKYVQVDQRSQWSLTRFLIPDPVERQYVSFEGGLQALLRESFGRHESLCALLSIVVGTRYMWLGSMSRQDAKDIFKQLEYLAGNTKDQDIKRASAFLTMELVHVSDKWIKGLDPTSCWATAQNLVDVLFFDPELLQLSNNTITSLTASSPPIDVLQELEDRANNPSLLYSNAGRLAKSLEILLARLSELDMSHEVIALLHRLNESAQHFERLVFSSGLLLKLEKEKPAWSSDFWKHLNYTAFTLCMAVNATKSLYASQPDLVSIVFSILEHSHFITVQFGNDGFSLWRDAIDFLMYAVEDAPDTALLILESAFSRDHMSPTRLTFLFQIVRFLLPNLPEAFVEDIAHRQLLPRLEKESDAPGYLIGACHGLMAALFESHTKFPNLVLRLLHPYFGVLLDVTLHHQPELFPRVYDAVLDFLCQTEYDAVNDPLEREKYSQVTQSIINQTMERFASLVDDFLGKDGMDKTQAEAKLLLESLLGQIEGLPDSLSEQVQAFAAEGLQSGPPERQTLFRESVSLAIGDPHKINYVRRAGLIQRFIPLLNARL